MSPEFPRHERNCWCVYCHNHAQHLLDVARKKVAQGQFHEQPRAADEESMEVWFTYEELK